ncbi:hypothetical protein BDQ17DRAFT_1420114 [Cyathus striatus]|nr:hypothetical protein BDQ17DRAFT_1420114 [Cyathus striatus]
MQNSAAPTDVLQVYEMRHQGYTSSAAHAKMDMDSDVLGVPTVTPRVIGLVNDVFSTIIQDSHGKKRRFDAKRKEDVDNFIKKRIMQALMSTDFIEDHIKSLFALAKEFENPWLMAIIGLSYLNEKCNDTSNAFFPDKLTFYGVNASKFSSKHHTTQESFAITEIYRKFLLLCGKEEFMKAKFPNVNAEVIIQIRKNSGDIKKQALACTKHIYVHVIKKGSNDVDAKNKYLLNREYLTLGEKQAVNKDVTHILESGVGKDIEMVVKPKDNKPQIHVVIDLELAKNYMSGSSLLSDMISMGTCKPDRVDQFHPGCVVSVTAYNFYSLHDYNMNSLLRTHIDNIQVSAANHNPINHTSMEATIGKLIGLSGP